MKNVNGKNESRYYEMMETIKACKTEDELLKVATNIQTNQKTLGIDDYQMQKLESAGLATYEKMQRIRNQMIKNKKQGFNNFED
jgi:hypothetical protein